MLSLDENTQAQAPDRTQLPLPIGVDAGEKRTHDSVWHGTTNLFAALNVGTGEVFAERKPRPRSRNSSTTTPGKNKQLRGARECHGLSCAAWPKP